MKKIKGTLLCGFLLAVFLLTGCMKGEVTLDMARDGSAQLKYKVLVAAIMGQPAKEEIKKLKDKGMTVEEIKEGDKNGFIASKKLAGLDELDKLGLFNSDEKTLNKSRIEKGFFYDEQIFDILYKGPKEDPKINPEEKKQRDKILSAVDFSFALNLPVAAATNNADSALNGGKNLVWKLKMVEDTHIKATAKVWHWGNILLVAAIAAGAGLWYYKKK